MQKRLNFKKELIQKLDEAEFYKKNPDKNGELKRNDRYYFLAIGLINFIAIRNSKQDDSGKYIGARILKEFSEDNYKILMNELLKLNIIIELEKSSCKKAGKYCLNPIYEGECRIRFSKEEIDLIDIKFKKQSKRGARATTKKSISIVISKEDCTRVLKEYGLDSKEIERQWETILKINESGSINPKQYRDSRLYSRFTELSKPLNKFIKIDDIECLSEIDLHATYFLLLPNILKNYSFTQKNQLLENEIQNLYNWIDSTNDVYLKLSGEINKTLSRNDIKLNVVSWLCSPDISKLNSIQILLDNWFIKNFPECHKSLNSLRYNKIFSRRAMKLEQEIFVSLSKILNKSNIDSITKHDCIIFSTIHFNTVESILIQSLSKKNIPRKFSTIHYKSVPPVPKNLIKENFILGTLENSETPILSDFQDILNQKTAHSEEEDRKTGTILCGFSKMIND